MRTAVLLEIEELLFDTLALRVTACCDALAHEGITVDVAEVSAAHAGVPASVACIASGPPTHSMWWGVRSCCGARPTQ